MYLPEKYLERMKHLLKEEYEGFLKSYESPHFQGIRVNTLKISVEAFKEISPFQLEPIPWTRDGFYIDSGERPGKHPYYHAGLYYIQEPSAMAPGNMIHAQPYEKILDLCAAPGGKTVQIAGALQNTGVLVSNDIHANRVKALIKNIELYGIINAVVLNDKPEKIFTYFHDYFDRVLVDAPCSGEGMFRKDSSMVKSWENYGVSYYAAIQEEILRNIDGALKSSGHLLYSTCTFSPEENEGTISTFLDRNTHYTIVDIPKTAGLDEGRPEWVNGRDALRRCVRLWPHKVMGEGHFIALLKKAKEEETATRVSQASKMKIPKEFQDFVEENLDRKFHGCFEVYNDNLYLLPTDLPTLKGLKIMRSGWLLGTLKKNRFEPSQALAMGLKAHEAKRTVNFKADSMEVKKYLKGDTLHVEGEKGWTLVCVDSYPLGWAKQTGDMLKNYYPAAWRWLD
ncbi:MAG: RsmF rRNA methyltransferase first C-terminal domain-containing protein [Bacillota bacterium]